MKGDDAVPVCNGRYVPRGGADGFTHLAGKLLQIPHGGVFAEDHTAVLLGVNLQGVAVTDNIDTENLVLVVF